MIIHVKWRGTMSVHLKIASKQGGIVETSKNKNI